MKSVRDIEVVPNPNIVYVVMEQSRRSRVLDRLRGYAIVGPAFLCIVEGLRTLVGR